MEVVLTAGLVNTIFGTASGARNIGANGAIAVGGYIALAGLWAAPISGASMNPVRSLAPDLVRGDLGTASIYVVGTGPGRADRRRLRVDIKGQAHHFRRGCGARVCLEADDSKQK